MEELKASGFRMEFIVTDGNMYQVIPNKATMEILMKQGDVLFHLDEQWCVRVCTFDEFNEFRIAIRNAGGDDNE